VPARDSMPCSHSHSFDSVADTVVTAASATVSNVVGRIGIEAGLRVQNAVMDVKWYGLLPSPQLNPRHPFPHSIGQLDKTDAPPIPEAYVYLSPWRPMPRLALRRPRRVRNSPLQHPHSPEAPRRIVRARARTRPVRPVDATRIRDPARAPTDSARDAKWPALLAALSFLLTTNLSDPLFRDVLGAQPALARTAGCLALPTPPDAFLTALANAALLPRAVAALDEPLQKRQALLPRLT